MKSLKVLLKLYNNSMPQLVRTFNASNFHRICSNLARQDAELNQIIQRHGYPPMWTRPASFQSLILFSLEQHVSLTVKHEDEIRQELKKIKGIGDWTVDVYLMHSLQRTDLFPLGDIALVNSLKEVKQLHPHISREEMLTIAELWRPYRTIAAMILWHAYIQKRGIKLGG